MVREADDDDVNGQRDNVSGSTCIVNSSSHMLDTAVTHQKVIELNCDWVRPTLKMKRSHLLQV